MAVWDGTRTASDGPTRAREAEVRRTVQQVRGYWYRAGVPRAERRRKAEELQERLEAAMARGGGPRDVTGDDLPAFAAAWAQADRRRPWLEPVLSLAAAVTLLPGATALLAPVVLEQDRIGIPWQAVALLAIVIPCALALQVLRWFRAELRPRQAAIVGALIAVPYVAGWMLVVPRTPDRVLVLAPSVAWGMVVVGAAVQVLLSWLKRTSRL